MSFKALQKSEKIINLIGGVIIAGLVLWALSFAIGILGSIGEDRKKARAAEALVKRPTLIGVVGETVDIPAGFTTHDTEERRKHYPFWFKLENDPDGLVTYYFNTGTYNFRTYDEWDFFEPYTKVNSATTYIGEALHLKDLLPVGSRVTFKVFQNEGLTRQVYDVIKIEPPVTTETASSEKHLESFRTHAEESRRITQDFIAHIDSETTTREQEQQFIRASLRAWEAQVKMASD